MAYRDKIHRIENHLWDDEDIESEMNASKQEWSYLKWLLTGAALGIMAVYFLNPQRQRWRQEAFNRIQGSKTWLNLKSKADSHSFN